MPQAIKARRSDHPLFETVGDYNDKAVVDQLKLSPALVLGIYKPEDHNKDIADGVEYAKPFMDAIKSVTFEEDRYMASMAEIEFEDPEFLATNSEMLGEGTLIDLQFGYGRETQYLGRRVQAVTIMPKFPQTDIPTLKIKGYDGRHWLTMGEHIPLNRKIPLLGPQRRGKGKAPRAFEKKTDSEAVNDIAYHFGFAVDLDPTTKRTTFYKDKNTSYWELIVKLAKRNNYDTWVDWDVALHGWCIHFRKKQEKFTRGYEFIYGAGVDGGTLLSFNPTEDLMTQVTDVEVVSFDKRTRKLSWQTVSETSTNTDYKVKTNKSGFKTPYGSRVKFRVGGRTIQTISSKPFRNKKDAKEFAKRHLVERQEDYIIANGTVVGTTNLRPRQIHKFTGIGRFSGYYKLMQTKHKITNNSTYTTDIVCYRIPDELDPVQRTLKQFNWDDQLDGGTTLI